MSGTIFRPDVQNGDFLSQTGGENARPGTVRCELAEAFPELALLDASKAARSGSRMASLRCLTLEQLEMLEAELLNQGILGQGISGQGTAGRTGAAPRLVSQRAVHDVNLWRWKALRFGIETSRLSFAVNLPAYLAARGKALYWGYQASVEPENSAGKSAPARASDELLYLERFAAYLNGGFDRPANRYQRGLNLVLRALCAPQNESSEEGASLVILPTDVKTFLRTAKPGCARR